MTFKLRSLTWVLCSILAVFMATHFWIHSATLWVIALSVGVRGTATSITTSGRGRRGGSEHLSVLYLMVNCAVGLKSASRFDFQPRRVLDEQFQFHSTEKRTLIVNTLMKKYNIAGVFFFLILNIPLSCFPLSASSPVLLFHTSLSVVRPAEHILHFVPVHS